MNIVAKLWLVFVLVVLLPTVYLLWKPDSTEARNVVQYRDTISDSAPSAAANHTFEFRIDTDVAPGGRLEFTPPAGFEILGSGFSERNVELIVDGASRTVGAVAAPGIDQVEITAGSPGFIRYTLAPDFSINAGSYITFKIGNHTSDAIGVTYSFSTTTGTTTIPGDVLPIKNSATIGRHDFRFEVWDGGLTANADFIIYMVNRVYMPGIDTTEEIPPYRFNGAPTSTVGGTTLSVEISLETDEFAICRFSTTAGVPFGSMTTTFENTGLIYHTHVVAVVRNTYNAFYVRCLDDEGNFNTDDFIIGFLVNALPTGTSNTTGSTSGNGTGTGNDGTGTGDGGGGTSGSSDGEQPEEGDTSGSGGTGGGSGGGGGRGSGSGSGGGGGGSGTGAGGFEDDDEAYQSGDARVIISGYAFPNSPVTILVDGKSAQSTRSSSSGSYTATIDAIARGVYTFGVYAESPDKVKSSTFSTSFTVTGARTSELTNINVAPSIKVSPNPVDPGQVLTVSGYALPNATILLQNGKAKAKLNTDYTTTSDGSGKWSTTIPTTNFAKGSYQVRAKATQSNGATSNFSDYTIYGVGERVTSTLNADLNRDGKINLVDFSILLFWWNSDGGNSDPSADINGDGKVTLTDFSIQLFNWTG